MKKIIIILVIVLIASVIFLFFRNSDKPTDDPTPSNGFPSLGTSGDTVSNFFTIETADGIELSVQNFLTNSQTVKDKVNEGYFYLGNSFPIDGQPLSENPEYVIEYINQTDFFNIGLFSEPIGESRLNAEEYLIQQLGITKKQMCSLKYTVSVPFSVNEYLAGSSLGFSFCKGSVKLQ